MNVDFLPGAGECPITAKNFSDANIRNNFMKKTFSIVGFQLLFTCLVCALMIAYEKSVISFLGKSGEVWLGINTALFLVLYFTLICSESLRRSVPTNYILLGGITLSMSIDLGIIVLMYEIESVINIVVMTGLLVGGLAAYAMTTKRDFTIGNVIWFILMIDVLHCFIWLFFGRYEFTNILFSIFTATSFCIYLIIDIQTLMSGKRRKMAVDDYIFGALMIYMDIIQIFIKLLELFGEKKDDKKEKK